MNKIVFGLLVISFLSLLILPAIVFGQASTIPTTPTKCYLRGDYSTLTTLSCPGSNQDCLFNSTTYDCGACCLLDTVYKVAYWIFYIVIFCAFIFIILGAFNIITAGGSPEKVQSGRNYIVYAVVCIIIALLAWELPNIVKAIVGFR